MKYILSFLLILSAFALQAQVISVTVNGTPRGVNIDEIRLVRTASDGSAIIYYANPQQILFASETPAAIVTVGCNKLFSVNSMEMVNGVLTAVPVVVNRILIGNITANSGGFAVINYKNAPTVNITTDQSYAVVAALADDCPSGGGGGSGTVTSFGFTNANGVSGTVTNPTTTPDLTISLGAITPSSVNGAVINTSGSTLMISGGGKTLDVTGSSSLSGTNTGDVSLAGENYLSRTGQVITANSVDLSGSNVTGTLKTASTSALTGDVTKSAGSLVTTISPSAVTSGKIADNAVIATKIAANSVDSFKIAAASIANSDLAGGITLSKLGQSGATVNQVPKWNGTTWIPGTDASGSGTVLNRKTLGTFIYVTSFPSLLSFTNNGATVSASGGTANFSSGGNTNAQTLDYNYVSCLENFSIQADFIATEKSATSYGFGIGRRSSNTTSSQQYGILARFVATTGVNSGVLYILATKPTGTLVDTIAASTALTWAVNDSIRIILSINGATVKAEAFNLTSKNSLVSATYTYAFTLGSLSTPNTGKYGIFSIGGTFSAKNFYVSSGDPLGRTVVLGDSKFKGYYSTVPGARIVPQLEAKIGFISNLSGGGDKTAELVTRTAEVISLRPAQVILSIGANDAIQGVSSVTTIANYDTIVSRLLAAGIRVVHAPLYQINTPITTLYTHIITTFPDSLICKTYEVCGINTYLQADGIHPIQVGVDRIVTNILSSGKVYGLPGVKSDNPLTGIVSSGGLIPFSAGGNIMASSQYFNWNDVLLRLGVGTTIPAYTLDVAVNAGIVASTFFKIRPSVGDIRLGQFGSLWNDGVTVTSLNGINFNNQIIFGTGETQQGELHLRLINTASAFSLLDRGAKKLIRAVSGSFTSSMSIYGGNAYAGSSNQIGNNLLLVGGLGNGTGVPGDIILATGKDTVSGSIDHRIVNRLRIKGNNGFVGIGVTTPGAMLHVVGGIRADSLMRVRGVDNTGVGIEFNNTTASTGRNWSLFSKNTGRFWLTSNGTTRTYWAGTTFNHVGTGYFGMASSTVSEAFLAATDSMSTPVAVVSENKFTGSALFIAKAATATGGDAGLAMISGATTNYIAADQSDSSAVKVGVGTSTIGSGVRMRVSTQGVSMGLSPTAPASGMEVDVQGDMAVRQVFSAGASPTATYTAATGGSGTSTVLYGGDAAFHLQFIPGSIPGAGDYITITFSRPLPTGKVPVVNWSENSSTLTLHGIGFRAPEADKTNTSFKFRFVSIPVAGTYDVDVQVIGAN